MYSRNPVLSIHSAGTASNCKQDRCNCSRASPYSKSEKTCNSSCKRQISGLQLACVSCDSLCSNLLCTVNPCGKCGRELLFYFCFLFSFCIWRKARASVSQFRQAEAAMQMQLQEALAFVIRKIRKNGWDGFAQH